MNDPNQWQRVTELARALDVYQRTITARCADREVPRVAGHVIERRLVTPADDIDDGRVQYLYRVKEQ